MRGQDVFEHRAWLTVHRVVASDYVERGEEALVHDAALIGLCARVINMRVHHKVERQIKIGLGRGGVALELLDKPLSSDLGLPKLRLL